MPLVLGGPPRLKGNNKMEIILRNDPRFPRWRIIELIQIRECQLRGEAHDRYWWDLGMQASMEELECSKG